MQYHRTSNYEFATNSVLVPVDILPDLAIQRFTQLVTASLLTTGALTAVPCSIKIGVYLECRRIGIFTAVMLSNRALL